MLSFDHYTPEGPNEIKDKVVCISESTQANHIVARSAVLS